ncbi:hypothetical protein LCGC14_1644310 [marine sediment metagenome]|uniref:Uncharacterized protein n=1 Tax=marine sediment metagenome TaxID=412755 RepID=A0A0F9HYQ1_9ZZZZ
MRYLAILLATILIIGFADATVGYGDIVKAESEASVLIRELKKHEIPANDITFEELKQEYEIVKILVNGALITEIFNQLTELKAEIAELRATVAASAKIIEKVKPLTTCARCDNEHGCRLYVICRLPCKCGCLPK